MNNERGGFLSKIFVIPAGVALMVGFFFLGYFVGKYQSNHSVLADKPSALPDIASQYLPKKEDLTFYKTLTEREEKTVSVDLKKKNKKREKPKPLPRPPRRVDDRQNKKPEKQLEVTIKRSPDQPKQSAGKIKAAPARQEAPTAAVGISRFTVQIGSYPERNMAEEEVKKMKKHGYAAFIMETELPEKGTWYRVRLGSFSNKASAEKLAAELKAKEGLDSLITIE